MKPYFEDTMSGITTYHGDCREVMATFEPCSIDSIVCDPPYGLEFMGKEWDRLTWDKRGRQPGDPSNRSQTASPHRGSNAPTFIAGLTAQQWHESWAIEALRVLKPGGYLLAFGGTRTFHRLTCAIEEAGFEIRDCLSYLYGSGFPKSLDVSKAAREWAGWGTALKPAWEPIIMARKPLAEPTVASNVLRHGTGAINIDGSRINPGEHVPGGGNGKGHNGGRFGAHETHGSRPLVEPHMPGRWPANVALDEQAAALLDQMSGERPGNNGLHGTFQGGRHGGQFAGGGNTQTREYDFAGYGDTGGASRFFYTAKASTAERRGSKHPTVKPLDLMRWLVRMVTPPGGTVLDPFAGSGTTLEAALTEGFHTIGIEQQAEYLADIENRLSVVAVRLPFDFGGSI